MRELLSSFGTLVSVDTLSRISGSVNIAVAILIVLGQILYSLAGLVLGFAAFVIGAYLVLLGVTGPTEWTLKFLGLEMVLRTGLPGVVGMVAGLLLVLFTRFHMEIEAQAATGARSR